jgi:hypothetical protein
MKNPLGSYLRTLSFWLRVEGVDGPQIVTVLAEVKAHVAESGENPYEAFGPPRKYAGAFSDGLGRSWAWMSACALSVVGLFASAYYLACLVAHDANFRPLPFGGRFWISLVLVVVAVVITWRAVLSAAVRPLASLATDNVDARRAWTSWARRRRVVSILVVVVILVAGGAWGNLMGNSYKATPKLRAANYVYATASYSGKDPFVRVINITVRAIVYLDGPGAKTTLSGTPSFSRDNNPGVVAGGTVQGFSAKSSALRTVKNKNFMFNDGVIWGTRISLGQYYVVSWAGSIQVLGDGNPPEEQFTIPYFVKGVGRERLTFPLDVNYSQVPA